MSEWLRCKKEKYTKITTQKVKTNYSCDTFHMCASIIFHLKQRKRWRNKHKWEIDPKKLAKKQLTMCRQWIFQIEQQQQLYEISVWLRICLLCWIGIWWDLNTIWVKSIRKGRMSKEKWVRHLATLSFVWSAIVKSVVENITGVTWKENWNWKYTKWRMNPRSNNIKWHHLYDGCSTQRYKRRRHRNDFFSVFFFQFIHFAPIKWNV